VIRHRAHRRNRRAYLLGLVAIAVLAAPFAVHLALRDSGDADDTGGGSTGPVELTVFWWGGEKRAELTEKALDLYEQRHSNVRFKTTWQGNSGYYDKLATLAAGGNAPDIFQIDDNALSEYAERNITLDLSPYVKAGKIDISRFPESLAKYGQVHGKTVGIAAASNTPALVYDRTQVAKLGLPEPTTGMTWEALIDWAARVTERGGGKVFGTMDPSADYKALWMWLRQQGKELYSGSELGFTADDLARWFELWRGARERRAAPPADIIHAANSGDVTKQLVVTKQAATSFMWSNQVPELSKGTDHELAIIAYPGNPSAQWARASMYWSAYRTTRHKEVVADVIDFLVNDPEAGRILGTERGLNPNRDVLLEVAGGLDATGRVTVAFETDMARRFGAAPAPPPRGHGQIRTLLTQAAESVQYGRATPAKAAEDFVQQAKSIIGR
jgi:multiple sugar transport system substrate-binding protein